MPQNDNKKNNIFCTNYHKQLIAPFVIYADFECITVPIKEEHGKQTVAYQEHKACCYGYKIVCQYDDKYSKPYKGYRGENAVYKLIENLLEEQKEIKKIIKQNFNKKMIISKKEQNDFENAKSCHICNKEYNNEDVPVRDHCQVTGKYRGSAHTDYNLSYRLTNKIDSHLIMQEIGKFNNDINVIPNNMEKYMAFMIDRNLIFIDSFQFMSQSLSDLAYDLPKDSFYHTKKEFGTKNLELITRKGVYPHDSMDDFNKFKEEGLPSIENFYSKLTGENISDCDYNHA